MEEDHFDNLPKIFQNINILMDSRVILAKKLENPNLYELYYIYKIGSKRQELISTKITSFQSQDPNLSFPFGPIVYSRRNLQQEKMRAALIFTYNDTLNHLTDYR